MVPQPPTGADVAPLPWLPLDEIDLPALGQLARRLLLRPPADPSDPPPGDEEAGLRAGLLGRTGQAVVPTATAALLFGRRPQVLQPSWGVCAVRVHGVALSDPIAVREDLEGNVASLLEQALAFVRAHAEQKPTPEYPDEAVREVVLNALLHRDLRATGRVAVRLFTDRLEVWSPGGLPPPLSHPDELVQDGGVSSPRNPMLAATARRIGLGEQIGRGLTLTRRAVARATRRPMELVCSPSDVLVVLPSAVPKELRAQGLPS